MRTSLLLVLSLVWLTPTSATADSWQFRHDRKWELIGHSAALPAYFFVDIVIHESSHALAGLSLGGSVKRFRPYPGVEDVGGGNRVFFWGLTEMEFPNGLSDAEAAWFTIAPQVTNLTLFAAADLTLSYLVPSDSIGAPFLLYGAMLMPWVDMMIFWTATSSASDVSSFARYSGLPNWSVRLMAASLCAVGAWRLFVQARRIFWRYGPDKRPPATTTTASRDWLLAPLTGPNQAGLALFGRF
jgi:hypothetical protein